jgi:DNA-binding XRE family transcriptional regulator
MENVISNFGINLRKALIDKGMKQRELADAVGLSYHTVSHLAKGRKHPSFETAIKIANVLGVTVDSLIK